MEVVETVETVEDAVALEGGGECGLGCREGVEKIAEEEEVLAVQAHCRLGDRGRERQSRLGRFEQGKKRVAGDGKGIGVQRNALQMACAGTRSAPPRCGTHRSAVREGRRRSSDRR